MKSKNKYKLIVILFITTGLFTGCMNNPAVKADVPGPVAGVELNRYLGTWYEIARLPNFFEKELVNVTATYSLMDNGKIKVENAGNKGSTAGKRTTIEGKAYVPNPQVPGLLKVSFFLWFASDYKIIRLDLEDYQYAVVTSGKDFLWILCRNPVMEEELYRELTAYCQSLGFPVDKLIKVSQEWK